MKASIVEVMKRIIELDDIALQLEAERSMELKKLEEHYKDELERYNYEIEKGRQEGQRLYNEAVSAAETEKQSINSRKEENQKRMNRRFIELKEDIAKDIISKLLS